jgi:hypothetical protein
MGIRHLVITFLTVAVVMAVVFRVQQIRSIVVGA